ncbi:hypothetical protein GCM10009559_67820 [Pseudonocardia zijingensis]|uniref:Uncharacterized protein n=1 Tax=Pseudonocardia zijingensis TaxID=153376 RepID=A0ABP3YS67_9PSEU
MDVAIAVGPTYTSQEQAARHTRRTQVEEGATAGDRVLTKSTPATAGRVRPHMCS